MQRLKTFWRDLGIAFENLMLALITPRHITEDELTARELLTKGRALGVYPKRLTYWMSMFMAVGASDDQVMVVAKILAKGRIDGEDIAALERAGIRSTLKGD